jgi:hypothetical protein
LLAERLARMQLIDGPEPVYLIKEHLDKEVLVGTRPPKP